MFQHAWPRKRELQIQRTPSRRSCSCRARYCVKVAPCPTATLYMPFSRWALARCCNLQCKSCSMSTRTRFSLPSLVNDRCPCLNRWRRHHSAANDICCKIAALNDLPSATLLDFGTQMENYRSQHQLATDEATVPLLLVLKV